MHKPPSDPLDPHVQVLERSLVRWRLIFLLIGITVPTILHLLFERQARRLDVLGARGIVTEATITRESRQGADTFVDYAYAVDGVSYTWNVAREKLPRAVVGESVPIVYSPDDPVVSRPGRDRSVGTLEAAHNRGFARKAVLGIFAFFGFNALLCEVRLRRLRKTGRTEATDPQAYRTRLILTGIMLAVPMALVFTWHLDESVARGTGALPVALGAVTFAILGGFVFYLLRGGRNEATARAARALRWLAPLAVGIAALRLLAWLVSSN